MSELCSFCQLLLKQVTARLKNFLVGWLLVLGLKEGLVGCATVCVKSWVILKLVCAHCRYMKEFRKTIKVCNTFCNFICMWVLSYKVLSLIYDRFEELTFYMQHTAIWFLSKSIYINNCTANNVGRIEFKIDLGTQPTM